jgi:uncharacterized protein YjbI with pentapeptide repeats
VRESGDAPTPQTSNPSVSTEVTRSGGNSVPQDGEVAGEVLGEACAEGVIPQDDTNLSHRVLSSHNLSGRTQGTMTEKEAPSQEELIELLKQGSKVWNEWRRTNPNTFILLSEANLSGINLSGADLRVANLNSSDLRGADLSVADLSDADLSDADLSGVNLSEANLSGANFSEANLSGADLGEADFSEANFKGANLTEGTLK